MSLFDLQDVCIAIGSLATLDLPMVVDLIGMYGLKGQYYARGSDVVEDPVASYSAISRCYLKIAKRCRLHKLIRQRFALAIKNQQEDFALLFQQRSYSDPVATQRYSVEDFQTLYLMNQLQATAQSSRKLICISCCYASSRCEIQLQEEKKQSAAVVVSNQQRSS
ncbi:hypothetical protein F511_23129 [Dorcoceras hygrometricum]|uniref:Uncharacterized protein n=1 Tax=Dorcoceras hygrometricum TaxID=472368 RepID=A0A2Z7C451_9LAMI|nr:hypothetical protein F511_23129 [Dorcoceras hygrometricum]